MTKPSPSRGFTLIELLVVIAIIAVLMGLLFPVINGIKDHANKAKAKNELTEIVNAVRAYYTEYGKYPIDQTTVSSGKDTFYASTGDAVGQANLFNILRATGTTRDANGNDLNPRKVVFIQPAVVKDPANPKGGIIPSSTAGGGKGTAGSWVDPWGTVYFVAMDTNYDNQLNDGDNTVPSFYSDRNFVPINTGVIAWSYGKDKLLGSKSGSSSGKYDNGNSDDVISWQ
jgi:prepilin-type N-terminal cleavage/methylation domain-containing protein